MSKKTPPSYYLPHGTGFVRVCSSISQGVKLLYKFFGFKEQEQLMDELAQANYSYLINMSETQSLKNRFMIFETLRNPKRVSGAPKIPKEFFSEPEMQSISQFVSEHLRNSEAISKSSLNVNYIIGVQR